MEWTVFKLSLALAAVEAGAPGLHDPANRSAAALPPAGFAFPSVNIERMLKISKFSIGLAEILERASPRGNGVLQHRTDDRHQCRDPVSGNLPGVAPRRHASPEQRLADVNVTESGYDSLIQ